MPKKTPERLPILSCPYCENLVLHVPSERCINSRTELAWWVECPLCGARGARKNTENKAIEAWNSVAALAEPWED